MRDKFLYAIALLLASASLMHAEPVEPECPATWVSGEYLLWWLRKPISPPLVTTGTPASQGILGRPGTTVLLGSDSTEEAHNGGRITGGTWFGECGWGIE